MDSHGFGSGAFMPLYVSHCKPSESGPVVLPFIHAGAGVFCRGRKVAAFEELKFNSEILEKILLRFWVFIVSRRVSKVWSRRGVRENSLKLTHAASSPKFKVQCFGYSRNLRRL